MRETGFQLLYIVVGFITVSLLVIEFLFGISEFFGIWFSGPAWFGTNYPSRRRGYNTLYPVISKYGYRYKRTFRSM